MQSGLVKGVEKFEKSTEIKQYRNGVVRDYLDISDNVEPEHDVNDME